MRESDPHSSHPDDVTGAAFTARLRWLTARLWAPLAVVVLAVILHTYPGIDLWVSRLFFDPARGFFLNDVGLVQFSYHGVDWIPRILVPALLWMLFASWRWRRGSEEALRANIVFLLVALLLGPGFLVNTLAKGESGRARPAAVEQFGGDRAFTAPFAAADQCERNCSFVSGHASMGFYFLAFAWVFRDRRWFWYGALIGAAIGLGRIVQGAHFFSDVVFSFVAVYLAARLSALMVLGRWWAEPPVRSGV